MDRKRNEKDGVLKELRFSRMGNGEKER